MSQQIHIEEQASKPRGKFILLGGGWVASRFAREVADAHDVVITCRTEEKCAKAREEMGSKAISVVRFELDDFASWDNVNSEDQLGIRAVFVTWALAPDQVPKVQKLLSTLASSDGSLRIPVMCLGTTSIYDVPNWKVSIQESSKLKETGTPLRGRADSEAELLSMGASVLHLSGLCGDDREIRPFFEKGWVRNSLDLVNLVHIQDVIRVMLSFSEEENFKTIRGKRINVSAGAFRYSDLADGLEVESPASSFPPSATSKIISTQFLRESLGDKFMGAFTMPVSGVKPVSQGWTSAPEEGGRNFDEYWELMRDTFDGCWTGPTAWYKHAEDDKKLDNGILFENAATNVESCYNITFTDADNGTWDGQGLRFAPGGAKKLPLSRHSYDGSGACVCFDSFKGCGPFGGQCTPSLTNAMGMCGFEANFFSDSRTRSMIIPLYVRQGSGPEEGVQPQPCSWRLESIGVAPFRCARGCEIPASDGFSSRSPCSEEAVAPMRSWGKHSMKSRKAKHYLSSEQPSWELVDSPFDWSKFASPGEGYTTVELVDGLLACLPNDLQPGKGFSWLLAARSLEGVDQHPYCKIMDAVFDEEHKLVAWQMHVVQP